MDSQHITDDLPAYSLGSLSPAESKRCAEHLKTCHSCRGEWVEYQDLVAALAMTLPQITPPARVKQKLLAQITPAPPKPSFWRSFWAWFNGPGMLLRAGSLSLILVLAAGNIYFWRQSDQLNQMQQHGYSSVLLQATGASPKATGLVVYTTDGKYGFLVVNDLVPLPSGKQYQLWLIKDNKRTSGAIFSVGQDGYVVTEVESSILLTDYDGFGVTIEPEGGSPAPTGERVLAGTF
jgi:anti-sigma-K factor RskA